MSKTREALEAAKEWITQASRGGTNNWLVKKIEAALAEPEQEPVCIVQTHGNWYYSKHDDENACGYCHVREQFKSSKPCKPRLEPAPQPREWQELSDETRRELFAQHSIPVEKWQIMKTRYITEPNFTRFYEAISAALRAKNGG